MATGNFTDWQGTMTEMGPLYPFAGAETVLVILGLVFWIGWHIWQARMETSNYNDDMQTLKVNGNMERALKGEKVLRSM